MVLSRIIEQLEAMPSVVFILGSAGSGFGPVEDHPDGQVLTVYSTYGPAIEAIYSGHLRGVSMRVGIDIALDAAKVMGAKGIRVYETGAIQWVD